MKSITYFSNGKLIEIHELLFTNKKLEDVSLKDIYKSGYKLDLTKIDIIAAIMPENKNIIKVLKNRFGLSDAVIDRAIFYLNFPKNNLTIFELFYDQNILNYEL